jgi:hypothetical protein
MVRILRILSVVLITFILLSAILTFQKTIQFSDWLNYFKISFSVLSFSLTYLLLDIKRSEWIGKIGIYTSIIASIITLISIQIKTLNYSLQLPISFFVVSYICVIYCRINTLNSNLKNIYWLILILPLGILFNINNPVFLTFEFILLIIISCLVLFNSIKIGKSKKY